MSTRNAQPPAVPQAVVNRPRALVIEDDLNTRKMIGVILDQEGFDVHEVDDGVDGIEQVRNGGFSLVVLDLRMPKIDGVGVMQFVRSHRPSALRNIIVTSALPPEEMRRLCDPDVCEMLPKPFDIEELRRMARRCASDLNEC